MNPATSATFHSWTGNKTYTHATVINVQPTTVHWLSEKLAIVLHCLIQVTIKVHASMRRVITDVIQLRSFQIIYLN